MSVVEEIKQRVDLVDLVGRYAQVKKAGSTYKANCPFHNERTPSFVIFPHTGTWHCFGACNDGGDAFSFLMRAENLEFREALEVLAKETGVSLEEEEADPERRQRARLFTINQAAATYFEETLADHPQAGVARAYLNQRQIDAATTKLFRLGYALESWDALHTHLTGMGYSTDELVQAGLLKVHPERNSTYDAFRGRLMIPITDRQGRVTGFGGRILGDGQPKYLNTAETALFHKSSVVYGIDKAYRRVAEVDKVVIVEGYMDVIAAHQHGFANVVACMGTAVTPDQLRQLQRYTNNFVLALDADNAGRQATIRALNQARQSLSRVARPRLTRGGKFEVVEQLAANLAILSMPPGMDPDDVIRRAPAEWSALIDDAQPLVDYYIQVVGAQHDLTTPDGKAAFVSEVTGLIAELGSEVERNHYVQLLARHVRMGEEYIKQRVDSSITTLRRTGRAPSSRREQTRRIDAPPADGDADVGHRPLPQPAAVRMDAEDHLVANLLTYPQLLIWTAGAAERLEMTTLQSVDLQRIENQEILIGLKRYITSDEPWDPELFQDHLAEPLHGHFGRLVAYGITLPHADEQALREGMIQALIRVRDQRLREQNTTIGYLLEEAKQDKDQDAAARYQRLQNQLARDLFHLQRIKPRLPELLFNQNSRREGVTVRR